MHVNACKTRGGGLAWSWEGGATAEPFQQEGSVVPFAAGSLRLLVGGTGEGTPRQRLLS